MCKIMSMNVEKSENVIVKYRNHIYNQSKEIDLWGK